jgi:hypothetical protein
MGEVIMSETQSDRKQFRVLKNTFSKWPIAALSLIAACGVLLLTGALHASAATNNIFAATTTPAVANGDDGNAVEVGMKFTSDVSGTVTGVRFYKGTSNTGAHVGHLWSATGTQLASATFSGETASGWQNVNFATPVSITANTVYMVSYYAPKGHYSYTSQGFASAVNAPPLHGLSNATSPNGVYTYTPTATGSFPKSSYNATNYWVDVDFTAGTAQPPAATVAITASPTTITAGGSTTLSWSSTNATSCSATSPANWTVSTTTSGTQAVSPTATTTYAMTCTGTGGSGNNTTTVTVNPVTPPPANANIFPTSATPAHANSGDTNPVSLGVKFQSDAAGYISGIRFYKGTSTNGGAHVGTLWSSTGSLLAQATFSNETASGWQDVTFSSSVAITANTTYVASYFAPQGNYSYDSGTDPMNLNSAINNAPLHALATSTSNNGVYGYGTSSVFPAQSYNGSDYWVDVDFTSTPIVPTPPVQPAPRAGVRGSGPLLVLTDPGNAFSDDYCSALLKTEGLPECATTDGGNLTSTFSLSPYRTIILADGAPLTTTQISLITAWVNSGGTFIAMRPDDSLDSLLGIGAKAQANMPDAYYKVNSALVPGIETQSMQYHGIADEHTLAGAQTLATLYSSSSTATAFPAVTSRTVGSGKAEAFMFDVSKSVFYTREGNPGLAGQVTNSPDNSPRINDRFGDGWLDASKVAIPQADELQRMLVNQIEATTLPRLWYFPAYKSGVTKAVAILTGDDHASANSQTLSRFAAESAASPAGCSVVNWTCYTSTSYAFPGAFSDTAAKVYADKGFEVSPHIAEGANCAADWSTTSQFAAITTSAVQAWQASYPTISAAYSPVSERLHCYGIWKDYASIAIVEGQNGIKADTNSECWPSTYLSVSQCMMTGTGMPENYVDQNGNLTNVYQFTTQATDENPATVTQAAMNGLVTNATGANAYYGYFTVLCHLDNQPISNQCASDLLSIAQTNNIPMVSGKQAGLFWDGRNNAAITNVTYGTSSLSFSVNAPVANLQEMTPMSYQGKTLSGVTVGGSAATFTTQTINGVAYAITTLPTGSSNLVASYQ